MYKKACKVVVLRNKPIAFLTSSLPSPSSLLKLPNIKLRRTDRETVSLPYRIPGCCATLRDSVNRCLYQAEGFFVSI